MADTFWDDANALASTLTPPTPDSPAEAGAKIGMSPLTQVQQNKSGDNFWDDAHTMEAGLPKRAPKGWGDTVQGLLPSGITDIPKEISLAYSDAHDTINRTLNPFSDEYQSRMLAESRAPLGQRAAMSLEDIGGKYAGAAAVPGFAFAPITGTANSVLGHTYSGLTRMPYEQAKQDVGTALMAVSPSRGGIPSMFNPVRAPKPLPPVTFTKGEETGNPADYQLEERARAGGLGQQAQKLASAFDVQRGKQISAEENRIGSQFSPTPTTPQEAGNIISGGIQQRAATAKQQVGAAYDLARNGPGELQSSLFNNMGSNIRNQLFNGQNPVIIDDKLTPGASAAVNYLDGALDDLSKSGFKTTGAPDAPAPGVSLTGVDQIRRKLSAFRTQAFNSGNGADGRAAQAVLDAFDKNIDAGVNSAAFTGDKATVQAWNDARAANTDYRSTFTQSGKNDPVGRIIDKITGRNNQNTLTGNDVADYVYGRSRTNPTSTDVGVANRAKQILGVNSPEWGAVKRGLFTRLVDTGRDMTDFTHARVAQNINDFLYSNGKEMADAVYSPADQNLLKSYADLRRKLEPPKPGGVNWSNTAHFRDATWKQATRMAVGAIGALASQYLMPDSIASAGILAHGALDLGSALVGYGGASKAAGAYSNFKNARLIAKQMPVFGQLLRNWQMASAKAATANTPLNHRYLAFATMNLASALQKHGINLGDIWNKAQQQ